MFSRVLAHLLNVADARAGLAALAGHVLLQLPQRRRIAESGADADLRPEGVELHLERALRAESHEGAPDAPAHRPDAGRARFVRGRDQNAAVRAPQRKVPKTMIVTY